MKVINQKGEGSIIKKKNKQGKEFYRIKIPVGKTKSGRTRYIHRDVVKKSDAIVLKRNLLEDRDNHRLAIGERITFKDFALQYLKVDAPQNCKATTINHYNGLLIGHVFPVFGTVPIRDINFRMLEDFFYVERKKYSAKTVECIRGLMSGIFSAAERKEIITRNQVSKTTPIKKSDSENSQVREAWSLAEAQKILSCDVGSMMHVFISLAAASGMRKGELLALQYKDVDLEMGVVSISKTFISTTEYLPDGTKRSYSTINTPKTKASRRIIQIHKNTIAALLTLRDSQEIIRGKIDSSDYIFSKDGTRPYNGSTILSNFKRHLAKYDVRYIRIHDVRHTAAHLLIANGASLPHVQQLLGHEKHETTKNMYANNITVLGQQASGHLEEILYPGSERNPVLDMSLIARPKPTYSPKKQRILRDAG